AGRASAQARPAADSAARRVPNDSARVLRPLPAFFMSLTLPGWSQAKLDRKLTAGLFVAWEGVSLGMALKAVHEVRYLRRVEADSSRIKGKQRERQDWFVLLAFNH